ncbi:alpha/beta fold hydrolase [Deinococcus sp. QL22]|uniref:alpha/beta fold hydrolase n=1 Tax=Deinococcus sp. QL22 TaxID=2939437 RepID=UPI002017CC32|nr:alpha/beta hydrolase [Deinococcus sp. QL22]UQN10615.1 alpha/beta hydrolase [Deinococcus sp. QL22]
MPHLNIPDAQLYYEVWGDGPPLVLLHGKGGDHRIWAEQISHFAPESTGIAFDHRGWGRSRGPLPEPWVNTFVPDLHALLEYLHVGRFHAIAQNMGGYTLRAFHATHPDRLSRVIMSGTTGGHIPDAWRERAARAAQASEQQRAQWQ